MREYYSVNKNASLIGLSMIVQCLEKKVGGLSAYQHTWTKFSRLVMVGLLMAKQHGFIQSLISVHIYSCSFSFALSD